MPFLRRSYRRMRVAGDWVSLTLAFLLASFWAKERVFPGARLLDLEPREFFLLLLLLFIWQGTGRLVGMYDEFRSRHPLAELAAVTQAVLVQFLASVVILFAFKTLLLSRFFCVAFAALLFVLVVAQKLLGHLVFGRLRRLGRNLRFVVIVGGGEVGQRFSDMLARYPRLGYRVIGFLDDADATLPEASRLGLLSDLDRVLLEREVDEVVIALPNRQMDRLGEVIRCCENHPTRVRIIPDYLGFLSPQFSVSTFGRFPVISLRANPLEETHWRVFKRAFDLAVALPLLLLVCLWLFPLLALAIKWTSPGPVMFKQERWGRKNRRIICYKFRTMVAGAPQTDGNGRFLQAREQDPRVTPLGAFLRKTSLDELPQLLNVLKGEMSIVGPRPHPTPLNLESQHTVRRYMLRHLVKPGITGWAQIQGFRGEIRDPEQMRRRVECDLWYIENWTWWLDLHIVLLTAWRMVRGDPNAY